MARKILQETTYTFSPATRTIVIPHYIPQERLVLITNVSTNQVIYNFSDSSLTATSYSASGGQSFPQNTLASQSAGQTTIVLNFNTANMSSAHKLQIVIDEYEDRFMPHETFIDPANKMRVSTPQSLIDTDFELGLQTTKWEFFQSQNLAQSVYYRPTDNPLSPVTAGQGIGYTSGVTPSGASSATITYGLSPALPSTPIVGSYVFVIDNTSSPSGYIARGVVSGSPSTTSVPVTFPSAISNNTAPQLIVFAGIAGTAANPSYAVHFVANNISATASIGLPISVNETFDELGGDGTFTISHFSSAGNSVAYLPKNVLTNYNTLNKPGSVLYLGGYYGAGYAAGSNLQLSNVVVGADTRTVTVTTITPHGLTIGAPIFMNATTQTTANGPFYVVTVPSQTTFTYNTLGAGTAGSIIQYTTILNLRPEGVLAHRPGDGGVQIATGNNAIGNQVVRQTRRYFRYQSGKGIQFSTAFTFKPNYDIVSLAITGQTAIVTVDSDHGLKPGAIIRMTGWTATNTTDKNTYNNTFTVLGSQPVTLRTFGIQLSAVPTDQNPGGSTPTVEVVDAKGYTSRAGLFDEQNGMFWEYDGASLNVVRRNSTSILRGTAINVLTGSSLVIGDSKSRFTKQVSMNDKIVIRGQTYLVQCVTSDTQMNISPMYRAATPSSAQGTSGLPFSTLVAASSTTQTINTQITSTTLLSTNTSTSLVASGTIGALGAYYYQGTWPQVVAPTASAGGLGLKVLTTSSASSLQPGQLIIGTNIPANTYIDSSYVVGSTSVPLTQAMIGAASGTFYTYNVPSPGSYVSGTAVPTGTFLSSIGFTTTGGATTTGTIYINQPLSVAMTAGQTHTYGAVPAGITVNVIGLSTTYGISPGMVITGTNVPVNTIVAFVQNQGNGIVLNQPINVSGGLSSGLALSFTAQHNLYANTVVTYSTIITAGATTLTMASTTNGIQIGSFLSLGTAGQYFPVGTYVTNINTATLVVTLNQPTTSNIPASSSIVFGSRLNVVNSTQQNVNGTWPVLTVTASTITFQTAAAAAVSATISTYGTTKIFAEDFVVRKFVIRELRIPQTNFNLDRVDGSGPSGFNADLTKVQMIFMDYTWYGAGFVRWGLRTVNGDIVYAHKLQHGNTQYQAYLRSGNLPGRFELTNFGAAQPLTNNSITTSGYTYASPGVIQVYDASRYFVPFTAFTGEGKNGEVVVDGINSSLSTGGEYFFYTGLGTTTGQAPWATGDLGVTSVATLGTPTTAAGSLLTIPVTSGGAGYTSPPPVVISGPGCGAQARANVVNGSVVSITVTSPGTGYTSTPSVYIGPNQLTGAVRETSVISYTSTATSTSGSTKLTSPSNIAYYYVGMKLLLTSGGPNFNYAPLTITGITGSDVYVDVAAVASGAVTVAPYQKGSAASNHYVLNNTSNPVSTVLNTNQTISPAAQHWGVSCMMDGRFDNDKSYVFTTPKQTSSVIQASQTSPIMSIRVSPSVSLGFARNFGVRDIINRMQLNLYQMDVYTSGQFLITIRYNCNSNVFQPALWTSNIIGSGSLAQVIYHNPQDTVTGGDVVTAFYATNAGAGVFSTTQQDLTIVKDLGNSVIGGDSVYPDGPDVITIFATNLSTVTPSPLYARISWNEAQA